MANGSNGTKEIITAVTKSGFIGVFCFALLAMIWYGMMEPSIEEKKILHETFVDNSTAMGLVAESSDKIAGSVDDIKDELIGQTKMRTQAMQMMSAFATEMREINPANSLKLDILLREVEKNESGTKLDIIIEKIEKLEP